MAVRGITVSVCLCLIAAPALAAFSKNEIRELEDLLARLGFNPGPVDGVLDAQTRIAIRDYQKFAALPVAGWASQRLLDEFGGGAIHFCGRGDHYIASLSEMNGAYAIQMSQPEYNDMETIFAHTADKGIGIVGLDRRAADEAVARGRDLRGRVHCN